MKKCYILLLSCFLGMTTKPNLRQGSRLVHRLMSRAMSPMVDQLPQQPRMSWDEAVNKKVIDGTFNVMQLMTWLSGYRYYPLASQHGLMNADIQAEGKTFANIVHYLVSTSTENETVLERLRVAAQCGADLTLPDNDGRTPLEIFNCSTSTLDRAIVKIFHENGATGGKNLPDNTVKILQELEKAQKARDLYNERFKTKNEA